VAVGSGLSRLAGYPFEVRYSTGSLVRARAAAKVAASAYAYFSRLFGGVEPDIALMVAGEADWSGNGPYGLPFFRDDAAEIRPDGYSTLEELQAHYTGGDDSMDPLNYVWYQHRWLRLAAKMFGVDGEDGLVRFWDCFCSTDRVNASEATAASLAPLLTAEVSPTLGRAVRDWR
jgi:hypothetical protein